MARTSLTFAALAAAVGASAVFSPAHSVAQEREEILTFDVTIEIGDGGAMTVREEIHVRALGERIRRGIYRDFPTSFPRRFGLGRIEAPFEVVSVTKNGSPEPFVVETVGGPIGRRGARVRIGSADVLLPRGNYRYVIEYRTARWVEFGDGQDRLYWNVTGNGWDFPIRASRATVRVANLASRPEMESWTGPEGSTGTSATAVWDASARAAVFENRATLGPREGMTIRVTFPAGQITPPSDPQRAEWRNMDWAGWIDAGWAVLFVVALYLLMWKSVGVDPAPGRVGVASEPPEGYSPAALGFIEARGYRESQLSAALVSMALKGAIRIEQGEDSWSVRKVAEPRELTEPLAPEELALFDELVGSRSRITFTNTQHQTLRDAIKAFRASLERRLEREYFVYNRRWFALGLAVSVIGFLALAWRWRFDVNPVALFLGVWLTGWTAGVATLLYRLVVQFRTARAGGGAALWAATGFLALFSIPFVVAEVVVTGFMFAMVPVHLMAAAIAIGVTNVVFYHLLERPTLKGRGVLDGLDGFRAYMDSSAEAADRRGLRPVDLPLYERWLPFAIALGLAARWTQAFRDALEPVLGGANTGDALGWYHSDHGGRGFEPSAFASSISSGLSSTLSAMSAPPASSGGGGGGGGFSGGGGSSGGGGGGGGGGGW